jgi:cytochrome c oxidase cbb3-type subunit 3
MSKESRDEATRYTADGTRIIPGPDGLEELDNPMPRWMTMTFIATFVWGVGYLMCMPGIGMNGLNWTQYKQYHQELVADEANTPKSTADVGTLAIARAGQPASMASGKAIFASNCAACHGAEAKGAIGPNLTDAAWLYGGKPDEIAHTISNGTAKGMPTFKTSLSAEQVADVAAFVHAAGGGQPFKATAK